MKQIDMRCNLAETRSASAQANMAAIPHPTKDTAMKTWIKRTLIGAATATLLLGGLAACSHRHHHGGWSEERLTEWRGKAVERIGSQLALDAGQKAKLELLANALMAQRQALRGPDSGTDPRAQFKALIAGDKFDRTAALGLLDQKTKAVQTQGPQVLQALADFYDSLNPQQQAQVREMLDKRGHGRW